MPCDVIEIHDGWKIDRRGAYKHFWDTRTYHVYIHDGVIHALVWEYCYFPYRCSSQPFNPPVDVVRALLTYTERNEEHGH